MIYFKLKVSTIKDAGVGVFSTSFIEKGTLLKDLFDEEDIQFLSEKDLNNLNLPVSIRKDFCIAYEDGYSMTKNFNKMSIGWYLNDSETPNLKHDKDYNYYAIRDIKEGEELLISYSDL